MAWRGWYPIGERFDDEGYSGATIERPGLERLIARIQDGDIQRVIVYRLDRLTRKLTDWALFARVFERFNVGLTIVHGAIDAEAGSLARLQLNLLATFAELERDMIGERLADARAAKKARGERAAGRVPLGYAADPKTKQLVIVESEAAVVRWFFTAAGSGKSTAELVARANALRLVAKNGKRGEWSARAVLRLLQNPVYAGRRPDGATALGRDRVVRVHDSAAPRWSTGRRGRRRIVLLAERIEPARGSVVLPVAVEALEVGVRDRADLPEREQRRF